MCTVPSYICIYTYIYTEVYVYVCILCRRSQGVPLLDFLHSSAQPSVRLLQSPIYIYILYVYMYIYVYVECVCMGYMS